MVWVVFGLSACSKADERVEDKATARTAAQAIRPAEVESHLLVTLELSSAGLKVLQVQEVAQPLPRLRVPEPQHWHLTYRDAENRVTYARDLAPANELRSETAGPEGEIEAHRATLETSVFTLRVPSTTGTLTLTADKPTNPSATPTELGHVLVTR